MHLEIHTLDIGQGDCQFLVIKNDNNAIKKLIMIDCGKTRGNAKHIINYWNSVLNSSKIDCLIITHWDSDHYKGLGHLDKNMFITNFPVYSPEQENERSKYNLNYINDISPFDSIELGKDNISIKFYAYDEIVKSFYIIDRKLLESIKNKSSIAILVECNFRNDQTFRYYSGGDLDSSIENQLAPSTPPKNWHLDSFKLSHHGSSTSTSDIFLQRVTKPFHTVAICSNGNYRRLRHPNLETLERLKKHNLRTILTNRKKTDNYCPNKKYISYAGDVSPGTGNIKQIFKANSISIEAEFLLSQLNNLDINPKFSPEFINDSSTIIKFLVYNFSEYLHENVECLFPNGNSEEEIERILEEFKNFIEQKISESNSNVNVNFNDIINEVHTEISNYISSSFAKDIQDFFHQTYLEFVKDNIDDLFVLNQKSTHFKINFLTTSSYSNGIRNIKNLSTNSPIEIFVNYFNPSLKYKIENEGKYKLDSFPLLEYKNIKFIEPFLSISEKNPEIVNIETIVGNTRFKGTIDKNGVMNVNNDIHGFELNVEELLSLFLKPPTNKLIPDFIIQNAVKIRLNNAMIRHNFKEKNFTSISYALSLGDKFSVDNFHLESPFIYFKYLNSITDNQIFEVVNLRLTAKLIISPKSFNAYIDFSSNNILQLKIDTKNLTFLDLGNLIPRFKNSQIESWASTLGLNDIFIKKVAIGINFNSNNKFQFLSLGLGIKIFTTYNLNLILRYAPNEKVYIYGEMNETMKIKDLFQEYNIKNNILKDFDDIEIDEFSFWANPEEKSYYITATIAGLKSKTSFKVGDINVNLESITFEIFKNDSNMKFNISITGKTNDSKITINSEYEKGKGFNLSGEIEKFNPETLLSLININFSKNCIFHTFTDIKFNYDKSTKDYNFSGNINIFKVDASFSIKNSEMKIKVPKINFANILKQLGLNESIANLFRTDIRDISINIKNDLLGIKTGEIGSIQLINNFNVNIKQIDLSFSKGQLNVKLNSNLDFQFKNNKIECEGGIDLKSDSKNSLSFYAESKNQLNSIFDINNFNINNLFVSLNESDSGIGIGFMGKIDLKDLHGKVTLYISINNPTERLLILNLSDVNLYKIFNSFIGININNDIKEILENITIEGTTLKKNIGSNSELTEDINETIQKDSQYIPNISSKQPEYTLKTANDYSWLPVNTNLIESKCGLVTYYLEPEEESSCYSLKKNILLYGCTSKDPRGINLNGFNFKPGFIFNASLNFFKVKSNVEISAIPNEGLMIQTNLEKSIDLANILQLSSVDDINKGPYFDLSTFPNEQHLRLSAKLQMFSSNIFELNAKIIFENHMFKIMINHSFLGFNAEISAAAKLYDFENSNFSLNISFNDKFSYVTNLISNELYKIVKEFNDYKTKENAIFENAQRTLDEYKRDLNKINNDINNKENKLKKLKKKHYPWYKAYKYVALAAEILFVEGEIAALTTYKLTQLALIETAKGVLKAAEKAVNEATEIASDVIKGVANLITEIGKGIDWLIKINELNTTFQLNSNEQKFDFNLDFSLCGQTFKDIQFSSTFKNLLENENKNPLGTELVNKISEYIHDPFKQIKLSTAQSISLDNVFGNLTEDEKEILDKTNLSSLKDSFECSSNRSNLYKNILIDKKFGTSIPSVIDRFKSLGDKDIYMEKDLPYLTNTLDNQSINNISEAICGIKASTYNSKNFEDAKKEIERKINDLNSILPTSLKLTESDISQNKLENISMSFEMASEDSFSDLSKTLLENVTTTYHDDINLSTKNQNETLSPDNRKKIITKYEDLMRDTNVHSYFKMIYARNLSVAYKEDGNFEKSQQNLDLSKVLAKDLFGEDSLEYDISNRWHSIIEE